MYINKIHIQNYRNFANFTMEFHKGLNVIIGANNSGKTGLLYAINLLNSPSDVSVDDFNKNNLMQYSRLYLETAPSITIEYSISHKICEDNTDDESIIRLLRFLYKGIIINHNKKLSQPTLKRRFFKKKAAFFSWPGLGKEWC